jgi:hypothetical protein
MSTDRETSPEMEAACHSSGHQNFVRFHATPQHLNDAKPRMAPLEMTIRFLIIIKKLIVMSTGRETSPEMEVACHCLGPQNFGRFLATPQHLNDARHKWLRSK